LNDPLNPIEKVDADFQPLTPKDEAPRSQWRRWHLPVLAFLVIGSYLVVTRHNSPAPYQKNEGAVFGTFYHFTYQSREDLHDSLRAELQKVDESLSMFNPQSTLRRLNSGETDSTDALFREVFRLSQQVSEATGGAFDITVAPLVNAWGFGYKNGALPDSAAVDSLRQFVGFHHVSLTADDRLVRDDPRTVLDCGAVAKGYGVDLVARFLRARGILNYMVEIGGEVVVSGENPQGEAWHVGVSRPTDDPTSQSTALDTVLTLSEGALATSGNYRNFYVTEDGRRVAHTINPATGYPIQHNILSATVLAPTCAEADAFATSFMVLGLDGAREVLGRHPELQVYFICDSAGHDKIFSNLKQ